MNEKRGKWEINDEADYVGNFFGWNISLIGAVVIIIFGLIIAYRWFSLPESERTFKPQTEEVIQK